MVEPFAAVADAGQVDGLLAEVTASACPTAASSPTTPATSPPTASTGPRSPSPSPHAGANAVPQTIHIGKPVPGRVEGVKKAKVAGTRYYARRDDQDDVVASTPAASRTSACTQPTCTRRSLSDIVPDRVDAIRLTSDGVAVAVANAPRLGAGRSL